MSHVSRHHMYKTTNANGSSMHVKIIHPDHPLVGQKGEVVDASYPTITIRGADGSDLTLPMSWTDYAKSKGNGRSGNKGHQLSIEGLLEIAEIVLKAKPSD